MLINIYESIKYNYIKNFFLVFSKNIGRVKIMYLTFNPFRHR